MSSIRSAHAAIRHGRLPRRGAARGLAQLVAIALAVVVMSSVSVAAIAVNRTLGEVHGGVKLQHLDGSSAQAAPQIGAISGAVNILLAGSDTRLNQAGFQDRANLAASSGTGNNDVTMVLHISADHTRAVVLSIPRDLMTAIPSCPRPDGKGGTVPGASKAMFNTSLSRGGLPCTVLTVEKLTGLTIGYAASISFDGVIAMSDAVGGVTVCLASPAVDPFTDLDLPAGESTLKGDTALAFVRSRHGVGDGSDLGRISSQQIFLSALMRKMTSAGVLGNPATVLSLANAAVKNMSFSDTLSSPLTMVSIAAALKGVGLENMVFVQYPTRGDPDDPNRVVALQPDADTLTDAIVADKPLKLSGKLGRAAQTADGSSTAPPSTTAPGATAPSAPPSGAASAPASGAPTDGASTAPDDTVALPQSVTGQTADQQTCAKGVISRG